MLVSTLSVPVYNKVLNKTSWGRLCKSTQQCTVTSVNRHHKKHAQHLVCTVVSTCNPTAGPRYVIRVHLMKHTRARFFSLLVGLVAYETITLENSVSYKTHTLGSTSATPALQKCASHQVRTELVNLVCTHTNAYVVKLQLYVGHGSKWHNIPPVTERSTTVHESF